MLCKTHSSDSIEVQQLNLQLQMAESLIQQYTQCCLQLLGSLLPGAGGQEELSVLYQTLLQTMSAE